MVTSYINLVLGALIVIFITRLLFNKGGSEVTGAFALLSSVSTIISIGIGWLSNLALVRFGRLLVRNTKHSPTSKSYRLIFWGFMSYGIITALVLIIAGFFWPDTEAVKFSFIWLGIYAIAVCLNATDMALLSGALYLGLVNSYRAIATLIYGAGSLLVIIFFSPRLDLIFASQAIGLLIVTVLVHMHVRKLGLVKDKYLQLPPFKSYPKLLKKVAVPNFLLSVLGAWFSYGDMWLIGFFLGPAPAAQYFIGTKIADIVVLLIGRITENTSPYYSRSMHQNKTKAGNMFSWLTSHLIVISIAAVVFYHLFAIDLIRIWLGSDLNLLSQDFITLAGAGIFFQVLFRHNYIILFTDGRQISILKNMSIETISRIVTTIILLPRFHFFAPVISYLFYQLIYFFWFYLLTARNIVDKKMKILPLIISSSAAGVILILIWWLSLRFIPFSAHSLTYMIAASVVYAVLFIGYFFIYDRKRSYKEIF